MTWTVGQNLSDVVMQPPVSEPLPVLDFKSAARATLKLLQDRCGMTLWMVTQTNGEDWIVLDAEDKGYGVKEGDRYAWSDSVCSRMVHGEGPRCAPDIDQVPAYAEAPINEKVEIGSYIGVPLCYGDGSLFGTLCAISPVPQSSQLMNDLPMIELMASMLSALLVAETRVSIETRSADKARDMATRDQLTGLYNRRGWDEILEVEESRCQRYGRVACVVSVDLDGLKFVNDSQGHGAGDLLIQRTADVLLKTARASDIVARVGGDEYAILALEANYDAGQILARRIRSALAEKSVEASIGVAARDYTSTLPEAWRLADEAMYEQKRLRKTQRVA